VNIVCVMQGLVSYLDNMKKFSMNHNYANVLSYITPGRPKCKVTYCL
jgi:hypothetical protein